MPVQTARDRLTATIVLPKAKESGSTWVLCWWALPPSVYGSSLIGVGMMLAAETVEITSGLAPGDTVLLGAARGISPGTPVKVSAPSDVRK